MGVTFGDMAEALHQLRQEYGLYYNPPRWQIFNRALEIAEVKKLTNEKTWSQDEYEQYIEEEFPNYGD